MTEEQKIEILKNNGWYQYYSKTHWVHENICEFYYETNTFYYGRDHTNHQLTVDKAYDFYLRCQQ